MAKKVIDDGLDDIREGGAMFDDDEDDDKDVTPRKRRADEDDDDDTEGYSFDDASDDPDEDPDDDQGDPEDEPVEEEEPEAETVEASEDPDDDLSEYSAKVRKRIERERRLKDQLRAEKEALEQRLASIEAQRAEESIESRLDAAVKELEEAREDVDTRREAIAQARVSRLVEEKDAIEQRKTSGQTGDKPPNPAYARWLKSNAWFRDPKHRVQSAAALEIAGDLIKKEGMRDDDPDFYRRLDRELRAVVKVPGQSERKPPPRGPLSAGNGRKDSGAPRKGRVVVTPEDKVVMRRFGLDPTNPKHLKEWATSGGSNNA